MNSRVAKKKANQSEQKWHDPVKFVQQWSIYRIPSKLRHVKEAAYTPQLISIGPFHHGNPKLRDMESHKRQYYKNFCRSRSSEKKDKLKRFIRDRKDDILCCYAGAIEPEVDFVKVFLVDACFIFELFIRNSELRPDDHENYYILRSPLLRKAVEQDLVLFENQLPYFVLRDLFDFAKPKYSIPTPTNGHSIEIDKPNDHPFLKLTCEFFKEYTKVQPIGNGVDVKHFTDLVRYFLCPEGEMQFEGNKDGSHPAKSIYCVSKLKEAGVKFRPIEHTERFIIEGGKDHKCNFNLARFRHMELKLTKFRARYEVECVIRNVMALEQLLYQDKPYVCSYFLLLNQLVDTVEDVNLLIENEVINNLLGSSKAVVKLINSLSEQILDNTSCYADISTRLNEHYDISKWNRSIAILKGVYFKDLWTGSSTILGIFVLVFSIIGTIKSLM